jgi:hypothetical protein
MIEFGLLLESGFHRHCSAQYLVDNFGGAVVNLRPLFEQFCYERAGAA